MTSPLEVDRGAGNWLRRYYLWLVVSISILFLGITATLKLYWVLTDPSWVTSVPISPVVYVVGICAELVCIALLIYSPSTNLKLLTGLMFFLVLTIVSVFILRTGQPCRCFGGLHAYSWLATASAIACLTMFVCAYLPLSKVDLPEIGRAFLDPTFAGRLMGVVLGCVALSIAIGNRSGIIGWQKQVPIDIVGMRIENDDSKQGVVLIQVRNQNNFEVELVGFKPSCHCVSNVVFPRNISPYGRAVVSVRFQVDDLEGNQEVQLFYGGVYLSSLRIPIVFDRSLPNGSAAIVVRKKHEV